MTLHVTNRLVSVTGDVIRDIDTKTAARVFSFTLFFDDTLKMTWHFNVNRRVLLMKRWQI